MLDFIKFVEIDENFSKVTKGSFEYKETLKKYEGKWNSEDKVWVIPNTHLLDVQQECSIIKSHRDREKRMKWQKALEHFHLDFVKKGSSEYQKVMDYYTSF